MIKLALVALALGIALPARAIQKNVGGNVAEFLDIGPSARALGMGEAYGPIAEGAEAIYWNPAGLAQVRSLEFTYSRAELHQFIHHDFIAAAAPVKLLRGSVGASFTRLSQESLTLVTNTNIEVGEFSPHSDAMAFAYATSFNLDDDATGERDYFGDAWSVPHATKSLRVRDEPWRGRLTVGAAIKSVRETLYQRRGHAIVFDGGALFRPADFQSFCLSFAFRNLGGTMKFNEERERLPGELDFGLSWEARSWKARWLASAEAALPYFGDPYAKLGVEYSRPFAEHATFSVRGGYRSQTVYELSPLSGVTFGLGARVSKFSFDFGFQPAAALGQVYRFTVGMKW